MPSAAFSKPTSKDSLRPIFQSGIRKCTGVNVKNELLALEEHLPLAKGVDAAIEVDNEAKFG